MRRSRILFILIPLLFIGSLCLLSSILAQRFLAISSSAYIGKAELFSETGHATEQIPRIVHRLAETSISSFESCRNKTSDYEIMLWTDTSSRQFIAENYPWFLDTYDSYRYPPQRLDALSYFILYHYGGVYIAPRVLCESNVPLDNILRHSLVLQEAHKLGISNRAIFSAAKHPFMEQVINSLATFKSFWPFIFLSKPITTGKMFLSVQYAMWSSSTSGELGSSIRVLPKNINLFSKYPEMSHGYIIHQLEWFIMALFIFACLKMIWWEFSKGDSDSDEYAEEFTKVDPEKQR